ncbi:MAG: hypothetical protein RhofKO_27790 [Rhodothermales bacterium]
MVAGFTLSPVESLLNEPVAFAMSRFVIALLAVVTLSLCITPTADAQLLKRIKNRAEERLRQRAEEKVQEHVDRNVDRAVDGVVDGAEARVQNGVDGMMSADGTSVAPVTLGPIATGAATVPALTYRQVTSMNGMGALSQMMQMMGENSQEVETVYVEGRYQRTDAGNETTILDAETATMWIIDHEARTYSTMSMAHMAGQAQAQMEAVQEQGADLPEMSASLETKATGHRATINGASAEQFVTIMKLETGGENPSTQMMMGNGELYMVTETWLSQDVLGYATITQMSRQLGQTMMDSDAIQAMPGLAGLDADALREAQQAMEGFPIETTMYMVTVPTGQALDLEAVLASKTAEAPEGASGLEGLMAMAAQAEAAEAATEQTVFMSTTTCVGDLQRITPDPSRYAVPEGYTERAFFGQD